MEKLESIFFYHLEKSIKTYRQYAQTVLKSRGYSITIDQWLVLKAIADRSDITQNQLAEMVFKDKASVTRITDILALAHLLKKRVHPGSARRSQLLITPAGRKLLNEIQPLVLKNRKHALRNIDENELKVTEQVLRRIETNCKK
jgi:DNA-binding MarR family transcriptional regulator